jgi:hypothetical protein
MSHSHKSQSQVTVTSRSHKHKHSQWSAKISPKSKFVTYRHAFIHRWADYKMWFQIWDTNGNPRPLSYLSDLCPLILITHNESVFFQNDEKTTCWSHQDSHPSPKPKGEGQSLMVSDFLTAEWGCLCDSERSAFFFFFLHSLIITL